MGIRTVVIGVVVCALVLACWDCSTCRNDAAAACGSCAGTGRAGTGEFEECTAPGCYSGRVEGVDCAVCLSGQTEITEVCGRCDGSGRLCSSCGPGEAFADDGG